MCYEIGTHFNCGHTSLGSWLCDKSSGSVDERIVGTCKCARYKRIDSDEVCPFCAEKGNFFANKLGIEDGFDILKRRYGNPVTAYPVHQMQQGLPRVKQEANSSSSEAGTESPTRTRKSEPSENAPEVSGIDEAIRQDSENEDEDEETAQPVGNMSAKDRALFYKTKTQKVTQSTSTYIEELEAIAAEKKFVEAISRKRRLVGRTVKAKVSLEESKKEVERRDKDSQSTQTAGKEKTEALSKTAGIKKACPTWKRSDPKSGRAPRPIPRSFAYKESP